MAIPSPITSDKISVGGTVGAGILYKRKNRNENHNINFIYPSGRTPTILTSHRSLKSNAAEIPVPRITYE